jgi:NAD(P)-dependent dehydrogenase (short-subunit alcohol dehydrogenase family)
MASEYPFSVVGNEFAGKRTLITGGTKGLGAAMAQRFVASGAKVGSFVVRHRADYCS